MIIISRYQIVELVNIFVNKKNSFCSCKIFKRSSSTMKLLSNFFIYNTQNLILNSETNEKFLVS